jgi:hypothetical protein
MTDYNTYLQTAAALCSAIAAIAAVWVAKNTSTFQENSLLKKASIEQILKLLNQFHYLKSLRGQAVLAAADENVSGLKQRISEIRESVMVLESMISARASADVKKICDVVYNLREENVFGSVENNPNDFFSQQLDDAISALKNIYRLEINA